MWWPKVRVDILCSFWAYVEHTTYCGGSNGLVSAQSVDWWRVWGLEGERGEIFWFAVKRKQGWITSYRTEQQAEGGKATSWSCASPLWIIHSEFIMHDQSYESYPACHCSLRLFIWSGEDALSLRFSLIYFPFLTELCNSTMFSICVEPQGKEITVSRFGRFVYSLGLCCGFILGYLCHIKRTWIQIKSKIHTFFSFTIIHNNF